MLPKNNPKPRQPNNKDVSPFGNPAQVNRKKPKQETTPTEEEWGDDVNLNLSPQKGSNQDPKKQSGATKTQDLKNSDGWGIPQDSKWGGVSKEDKKPTAIQKNNQFKPNQFDENISDDFGEGLDDMSGFNDNF